MSLNLFFFFVFKTAKKRRTLNVNKMKLGGKIITRNKSDITVSEVSDEGVS